MSAFWTDAAVRAALELPLEPAHGDVAYAEISSDTRSLRPGGLFVALRGPNFDAHDFLPAASAAGASGAVLERPPADPSTAPPTLYLVKDTLAALGRLARYRRRRLNASVCAITGSNGKTTTKDMARAVLARRYRVHATTGNLNNLVGTPLTLLGAPDDVQAVVVELGTNAPGEIARLGEIVEPDAAIITNVAQAHLEGLADLAGVLREKLSLLAALREHGLALVGEEPSVLPEQARALGRRVRVAGWSERADPELRARGVELDGEGRVRFDWAGREVRLAFRGRAYAHNALLALGLGLEWGVSAEAGVAALESLRPPKLRAELLCYGGLTVVADCYNANPASVAEALDLLVSLPRRGGRVLVLGTMRELGRSSAELHARAALDVAGADIDLIVATGEFAAAFEPLAAGMGERLIRVEDPLEAYEPLARRLTGGEVVLLKGSRGVALERLLPRFEADWGSAGAGASGVSRGGQGASASGG
ncbi:MAG: UDP-N-acetylmuramoyl-tripeptide--D-alanyl-D-alanine ligase [Gemmatimonadetes bacterium]|nr:UDP-N-acetylmuramoyl-tripeptide--D-alanyl-D-alanine ligase [Gemmatimonadota bacterium]